MTGETVAAEVTRSYEQAWALFGRLDPSGHYKTMFARDSRTVFWSSAQNA
ncbi:hypothetical protein [Rhodococcus opacus]|nr:hypothetical protein [Rhodococcus opacus]MBV6762124.1 hypothetical protein [Rhodococcus opacus]